MASFLESAAAAEHLGISPGYLRYLRTDQAKKKGHTGPAFYRVNLNDGSPNPHRVRYKKPDLDTWSSERDAKHSGVPTIERVG